MILYQSPQQRSEDSREIEKTDLKNSARASEIRLIVHFFSYLFIYRTKRSLKKRLFLMGNIYDRAIGGKNVKN